MQRAILAATLCALIALPLYGQRGGMHFSGGAHFSGGRGGMRVGGMARPAMPMRSAPMRSFAPRFSGPRTFSAPRPMYWRSPAFRGPVARPPRPLQWQARRFPSRIGSVPRPPAFASTRVNRGGFWFGGRRFPRFDSGFGRFGFHHRRHFPFFLFAFPFYPSPFFYSDPFFFADAGLSYGPMWNPYYSLGPYSYDLETGSATYSALSNQLNDLSAQVQALQTQNDELQADLEQRPYPYSGNTAANNTPPEPTGPPTLLIFRDGHRLETQNYAIVGSTLWILSDQRASKYPLSDLDLDQTIKANQERGLTFPVGHTDR